jgi:hypothetical protein
MTKTVSKWNLFTALAKGGPLPEIGANSVTGVAREDGSNRSYNVTFYNTRGDKVTEHVFTEKPLEIALNQG